MRSRGFFAAGLAMVLLSGAWNAVAQKKDKDKTVETKTVGDKVREVLPASEPVFTEQERILIKGWFGTHRTGLPPGLAKKERLPPGLEKQLRTRGTLPPGLQKKIQPLPLDLSHQLRRLPTGYRRVVIAGNVILMNEKTAVIYDIIRDVIP
jgi:hypothetical protein